MRSVQGAVMRTAFQTQTFCHRLRLTNAQPKPQLLASLGAVALMAGGMAGISLLNTQQGYVWFGVLEGNWTFHPIAQIYKFKNTSKEVLLPRTLSTTSLITPKNLIRCWL